MELEKARYVHTDPKQSWERDYTAGELLGMIIEWQAQITDRRWLDAQFTEGGAKWLSDHYAKIEFHRAERERLLKIEETNGQ